MFRLPGYMILVTAANDCRGTGFECLVFHIKIRNRDLIGRIWLCWIVAAALAGSALAAPARAQDLGEIPPGSPLTLPLDTAALTGEIAIEIGTIDVTEFASIVDGQIVLAPGIPLEPGRHEILVYLFDGNDYQVIGSYSFTTPGSRRGGSAGATVSVTANHEIGPRSVNDDVDLYLDSAGTVELITEDGSLSGRIGYRATSEPQNEINGNPFDITEYFLEYRRSGGAVDFTGRLGHQTLNYDPALVGDISRRGVSMMFATPGERFSFGLFGVRARDAFGAENFTGLQREQDRIFGAQVALRPFERSDFRISLQGYDGEGTPDGGLIAGIGSGYSIGLDGSARSGRLRYGAYYGEARWDEDGGGAVFAEEKADAVLGFVDYDLMTGEFNGHSLTVGLGYERIDLPYFSLANPGLYSGAETWIVTADYRAERLGLTFYADTQKTNEGGAVTDVTDRITYVTLDGSYDLPGDGAQVTSLRFGTNITHQNRLITPAAQPTEDFTAIGFNLGVGAYDDTSSWSVDYNFLSRDDHSAMNQNEISHGLTAAFDRRITGYFNIYGNGSVAYVDAASADWWRTEASLGLRYQIVPVKWSLALDVGATATEEPGAQGGGFGTMELAYNFTPAAAIVFSASYNEGAYASESGAGNDTIFGLFLRADTNFTR